VLTEWLGVAEVWSRRGHAVGRRLQQGASDARVQSWLKRLLVLLLMFWLANTLARLSWHVLPQPVPAMPSPLPIINPPLSVAAVTASTGVDIERLLAVRLFGAPGAEADPVTEPLHDPLPPGIEDGARETRLALALQGIIASSDPQQARAIIQQGNAAEIYAVGDVLPVGVRVTLAKILSRQVVLDNAGVYELLTLYELDERSGTAARAAPAPDRRAVATVAPQSDPAVAAQLAQEVRARLYSDPQSLAELVQISPVRDDGLLRGYRLAPGRSAEQFAQLGFAPGDVVTAINGIDLSNPGNTLELYAMMRNAREASFELLRDGQSVTLTVSLGDPG